MSSLAERIRKIKEESRPGQKVLLVEGKDDKDALQAVLSKVIPDWELRWAVHPAGKQSNVIGMLGREPTWHGMIDRDAWDAATLKQYINQYPHLWILPRWCIESYLIQPDEWWSTLAPEQQAKVALSDFTAALDEKLSHYLRHAVLWSVVHPLWNTLREAGFVDGLASAASLAIAQDDAEISSMLTTWHIQLEPETVLARFHEQLAVVEKLPKTQQLTEWVHGKCFWEGVVAPALNRYFGQKSANEWQTILFQRLPFPADWQPLLERMRQWEGQQP